MFLTNLFKFKRQCLHEKVHPSVEHAYCPDCGKYIENEWYITRCACCGVKLKTRLYNNDVVPQYNYCANCGSKEFKIEKLAKINFIDINFAVLVKKEVNEILFVDTIQCWEEKNIEKPKLLVQYL